MAKDIFLALIGNILFGTGYYFALLLHPLTDTEMLGVRIIILLPIIFFAIFLFRQQESIKQLIAQLRRSPALIGILLLLTLNTGVQLWLFVWTPNNHQAIQVSIGYLLLTLVAVALGKLIFKEHLSRLKWWALVFAGLGVGTNMLLADEISWATFVAGFGYPIYIALRRYFKINTLATFCAELLLLLPLAVYFIWHIDSEAILQHNRGIYAYLTLFGLVNGTAFILYIYASNLLPINVLGLLGYAEPLVMLLISFAIGEVLTAKSYLLLACLLIAMILLAIDNLSTKRTP